MLNIWHTKKPHLSDVPNLIFFATCYNRVTNLPRYGQVWHMDVLFFLFLFLSHISFIFSFSYSPPHLHSPILFLLPSSILLYSLLIHESWATTDFLSTISQIPSSLIYKISFTGFSPLFVCSLLSVLSQSRLSAWVWLWVCDFWLWSAWV